MTAHPLDAILASGVSVNKATLKLEIKKYPRYFTDAVTFRAYDLPGVYTVVIANQLYRFDALDLTTADNGMTCIHDASARRFKVASEHLSAKDFGAVGDGVADDTAAIQAAIDAATAGDELFFPRGVYVISSQLNLNKKLKWRGAITGEGGGIADASGSKISGSGFTLVRATEAFVIEDMGISDPTGHASTIALDINDGATGVVNWELRNVYLSGTASKLGTGLRTVFGLKGSVFGGNIDGWSIGIDQQASGANKSNANCYTGVKIRANATGLKNTDVDDVSLYGCTLEGNSVNGIEHLGGLLYLSGNHLENAASGANVKVSAGNLVSQGNYYGDAPTSLDIWISAGSGLHSSSGDTLNTGIKHEGTGVLTAAFTANGSPTVSGTGPIARLTGNGMTGLQGLTGQVLTLSGYAYISTALALFNAAGAAKIGGAGGLDIVDGTVTTVASIDSVGLMKIKRIRASNGTALVAADFALSAGWGVGATVTGVIGTDQAWTITVTAAGTPAANPTVTLIFKDGTFTNSPICVSKMTGGTGAIISLTEAPTATTNVLTFNGTPVAASTYVISSVCLGR